MSINSLLNIMRRQASTVVGNLAQTKLGTISSYDPSTYTVKVLLIEGDNDNKPLLTGWLPVFSPWIGNNWGLFCPPTPGDLCEVHFQEGDLQNGYVGLRSFNDVEKPLPVASKEFWLVHESGSSIKLTNDGKININGNVELDLLSSVVKIGVENQVKKLVTEAFISAFNSHRHTIPSGTSGVPTAIIGNEVLTTNTKAS